MKHIRILAAMAGVAFLLTPLAAAQTIEINYQNLNLGFNQPGKANTLVVSERSNSIASAFLKSSTGTTLDSADIFNITGSGVFALLFSGAVTNGAGTNDLSIDASYKVTDTATTLANPSVAADFLNANLTGDVDGVSFGNGILRIEGIIRTPSGNDSLLLNPTPDWVYQGGAIGTPAGADGVADQITVGGDIRTNYQSGILAVLEVSLDTFADGTSTQGLNADQLFAQALLHGGFVSSDAQIQLTMIPVPGAALLGVLGLSIVRGLRRRIL